MHFETNLNWLKSRLIYITKHGSHAYGTNGPNSDLDIRGVCIPPLEYYFGFQERFEQTELKSDTTDDVTIFGLQKFMKLAADANPNILELLWTDPKDRLWVHPLMNRLFEKRDLFLSRRVAYTFSGYAVSQLKKLERSRERPPERVNPIRADLIKRFGYDTKDAMHVVRLLRMGLEILDGKGVQVRRPDAEELLKIRDGAWSLDKVLIYARRREEDLMQLKRKSKLPNEPDRKLLDQLCLEIIQASFTAHVFVPIMAGSGFQTHEMTYGAGRLVPKILSGPEDQSQEETKKEGE